MEDKLQWMVPFDGRSPFMEDSMVSPLTVVVLWSAFWFMVRMVTIIHLSVDPNLWVGSPIYSLHLPAQNSCYLHCNNFCTWKGGGQKFLSRIVHYIYPLPCANIYQHAVY